MCLRWLTIQTIVPSFIYFPPLLDIVSIDNLAVTVLLLIMRNYNYVSYIVVDIHYKNDNTVIQIFHVLQ